MDKSIITSSRLPVRRETRFRQPNPIERRLGLWVDRIGAGGGDETALRHLRVLGQYAVVAVESNTGHLLTRAYGRHKLNAGDVILLTPSEPAVYAPDADWFTRWIVWNGPAMEALMHLKLLSARMPVIRGAAATVTRAFNDLARCMQGEDLIAALKRKIILLNMLFELRQRLEPRHNAHEAALTAVIDHIGRNLDRNLPIEELARQTHLSMAQFRRLFAQYTGRSPLAFVAAQRIARAKALLSEGIPIKNVGVLVGYPDPSYFMRVFRRVSGETAGRFIAGCVNQRTFPESGK